MAGSLRLSELTQAIQGALDSQLEPSYWVVAEIGELRIAGKGHCYLDLVEKQEKEVLARTRANIWAYNFRNINAWFEAITGSPLKAGMEILCQASVQFHSVYGLSLTITDIDPAYTLGAREKKRQETITQLQADGIFDMNRMLDLPLVPQKVAVISSATAAGFGDFLNQIEHNPFGYSLSIRLFPARMQGAEAATSIIDALHEAVNHPDDYDIIIVIRGGGAQMDMDCFDDYDLCSHIAQCPKPVLTGIGHERDETIADLVAHTKLKTPTAVAEFLINGFRAFEDKLQLAERQLQRMLNEILNTEAKYLDTLHSHIISHSNSRINEERNKLKQFQFHFSTTLKNLLKNEHVRINRYAEFLRKSVGYSLQFHDRKLEYLSKNLSLLDPLKMLERGYTLSQINGKRWGPEVEPHPGEELITLHSKFRVSSTIRNVEKRVQENADKS
jgi:exodeoxyribonuclease VII large subunit